MELKTFLSETEEELLHPEQALLAWTNGLRTIAKQSLSEGEILVMREENNHLLQDVLVRRLISCTWSARVVYNAIEEQYPILSKNESQRQTRKILMTILQAAMNVVDSLRIGSLKSVDLI